MVAKWKAKQHAGQFSLAMALHAHSVSMLDKCLRMARRQQTNIPSRFDL